MKKKISKLNKFTVSEIKLTEESNKKLLKLFEFLSMDVGMRNYNVILKVHRGYRLEGKGCEKIIGYCPTGKYHIVVEPYKKKINDLSVSASIVCGSCTFGYFETMIIDKWGNLSESYDRFETEEEVKEHLLKVMVKKIDNRKYNEIIKRQLEKFKLKNETRKTVQRKNS